MNPFQQQQQSQPWHPNVTQTNNMAPMPTMNPMAVPQQQPMMGHTMMAQPMQPQQQMMMMGQASAQPMYPQQPVMGFNQPLMGMAPMQQGGMMMGGGGMGVQPPMQMGFQAQSQQQQQGFGPPGYSQPAFVPRPPQQPIQQNTSFEAQLSEAFGEKSQESQLNTDLFTAFTAPHTSSLPTHQVQQLSLEDDFLGEIARSMSSTSPSTSVRPTVTVTTDTDVPPAQTSSRSPAPAQTPSRSPASSQQPGSADRERRPSDPLLPPPPKVPVLTPSPQQTGGSSARRCSDSQPKRMDPAPGLYSWGGTVHTPDLFGAKPTIIHWSERITDVQCGRAFALLLNDEGEIYSWGTNSFCQLGLPDKSLDINTPHRLQLPEPITAIRAGENLAVAKSDHAIYAWGGSDGNAGSFGKVPTRVAVGSFSQLACGDSHCIALSDTGVVFAWGRNNFCQLGMGDRVDRLHTVSPCHLPKDPATERVLRGVHIAAAGAVSIIATEKGIVTFGGFAEHTKAFLKRPAVVLEGVFKQVACSWCHCLAVSDDGKVYSWGDADMFQTGTGLRLSTWQPQLVKEMMFQTVKKVACGGAFSNSMLCKWKGLFSIAITDDGVYGWGGADHKTIFGSKPTLGSRGDFVDIACGATFALLLDAKGVVYVWGMTHLNTDGEGTEGSRFVSTPQRVDAIKHSCSTVRAGSYFCVAV